MLDPKLKRLLLLSTALTPLLTFAAVEQGNAQAVAYPNQTLSGLGGTAADSFFGAATGRFAIPIGPSTGGQFDGVAGTFNERFYGQAHGHFFWRDPLSSLFELYGGWTQIDGSDTGRIGGEVEFYRDGLTLSGVGGAVFGDLDGFFSQIKLSYYLSGNTKLFAGYIHEPGYDLGNVGFEHMFDNTDGLTLFGEARFGSSTAAWLGLRRHFGGVPGKDMINRDREDLAPLWLHVADEAGEPTTTPTTTPT